MYIMCVILCLFSAFSRRVGALQISIITIIASLHCELINPLNHCIKKIIKHCIIALWLINPVHHCILNYLTHYIIAL